MVDASVVAKLDGLIGLHVDFPKAGIVFRDVMGVLADGEALALAAKAMAGGFLEAGVDVVVGTESRGFLFGVAVARELGCGFVPVRKSGKLPGEVMGQEYELEYGTDRLEMQTCAVRKGQRVLMVDDLLATGGTMAASCKMVERLGGEIVGISFLVELSFLGGRKLLGDYPVSVVIRHESE